MELVFATTYPISLHTLRFCMLSSRPTLLLRKPSLSTWRKLRGIYWSHGKVRDGTLDLPNRWPLMPCHMLWVLFPVWLQSTIMLSKLYSQGFSRHGCFQGWHESMDRCWYYQGKCPTSGLWLSLIQFCSMQLIYPWKGTPHYCSCSRSLASFSLWYSCIHFHWSFCAQMACRSMQSVSSTNTLVGYPQGFWCPYWIHQRGKQHLGRLPLMTHWCWHAPTYWPSTTWHREMYSCTGSHLCSYFITGNYSCHCTELWSWEHAQGMACWSHHSPKHLYHLLSRMTTKLSSLLTTACIPNIDTVHEDIMPQSHEGTAPPLGHRKKQ